MGLKAVVGLDIGNTTIKVAEVRVSGGRPYVSALGVIPTPPDSVNQSMIVDAEGLAAAIKELLVSSGVREKRVVSSVGGQQALVVRIIEVPKMTPKELAETMKWEVERHVPFASSELQMDYRIIDRPDAPPEAQTMEVLLVVAQQEMINTHVETVGGAGLDPVAIDVEPLAVTRALVDIHGGERQGQTVAVVNVGALFTDVSVVRDGSILFQRTIAAAGQSFTQAIAGAANINNDHAERIKKTKAAVDLDAFMSQPSSDVFGGGGGAEAFGFGVPPAFGGQQEEAPAAEEPTLFNPFATESEEAPAAAPAGDASPFAAPTAEPQAQWSPFGGGAAPETPDGSANPFAAAAEGSPSDPNPFARSEPAAEAGAGAGQAADDGEQDAFDLGALAGGELGVGGGEDAGAAADELTPRQVFDIIREPLSDLVTEIKRSVDYYRGRSSDATIDMILLSGGTARLPDLDQLLAGELSVPVVVADPFQAVPVQSTQYSPEYLKQVAPMFAVSVGLGLRETVF